MILTFASQNLEFGGLSDSDGKAQNRWPALLQRIASVKPSADFVLLQETRGWEKSGHRQLAQAMRDLDMDALPLPPSQTGNGPGLLYKAATVGRWQRWNTDYAWRSMHGFGVAAFDIGLPNLLSVVSAHIDPFSQVGALAEVEVITTRAYRYGPYAVIRGDCNYPPARGPEPDYKAMRPYNIAARTLLNDPAKNEPLQPNRQIGWMFEKSGFVDAAQHLYERTRDEALLQLTATDDRIDQFWVSELLAPAITKYWVINEPAGASDHKGIAFQLDSDLIDTKNAWEYR